MNDSDFIILQHIIQLYNDDLENGLKLLPRITSDHIRLTSYSVMRVNLAAQILSSTVLQSFRISVLQDHLVHLNIARYLINFSIA